jgi:phospholipid-binding lipoprotein MlaA
MKSISILRHLFVLPVLMSVLWFGVSNAAFASADISELGDISNLRDQQFYVDIEAKAQPLDFLDVWDPIEPFNKRMYAFNRVFDDYVFLPALTGYRFIFPEIIRGRFQDFWANLGEVINIYNSLLQFKFRRTATSTGRLLVNTTVGIGGLWDPATKWLEIERANEDFGQTLGHWGVGPGPFLVLPIFGPSNLRDTTGLVADYFAEKEIDFMGIPEARSRDDTGGWLLKGFYGLNQRDIIPFRYGVLGSPFEYNKIRYLFSKQRELLVAE